MQLQDVNRVRSFREGVARAIEGGVMGLRMDIEQRLCRCTLKEHHAAGSFLGSRRRSSGRATSATTPSSECPVV